MSRESVTSGSERVPAVTMESVLAGSEEMPAGTPVVRGPDFNGEVTLDDLMASYATMGFQASNLSAAVDEINRMRNWRMTDEPVKETDADELMDPVNRAKVKCTIFLGYTSNQVSCGQREVLRFLVQHKLVDAIVTTAGGIEEDIMKCYKDHYMGDFALGGAGLRARGLNRIGNLIVPNNNYCSFEDFLMPIIEAMAREQHEEGATWTPSTFIARIGQEVAHPDSICYWAWKNDIPIFSPALTDGSVGDMLYLHTYRSDNPMTLDLVGDIRRLTDMAVFAQRRGIIVLGGGLVKHHLCNACLLGGGAEHAVFINTGQEFDGSDAGARPDEAISWGKIRADARPVKVYAEATIVFPLIVSQTFAKDPAVLAFRAASAAPAPPAAARE